MKFKRKYKYNTTEIPPYLGAPDYANRKQIVPFNMAEEGQESSFDTSINGSKTFKAWYVDKDNGNIVKPDGWILIRSLVTNDHMVVTFNCLVHGIIRNSHGCIMIPAAAYIGNTGCILFGSRGDMASSYDVWYIPLKQKITLPPAY